MNQHKIEYIEIENLLLDKLNPRIYQKDVSENINQTNLSAFIYKEFGIADLSDSILKNGYFPVEPMVAIPEDKGSDKYIVVEGNRRLTTIKILCFPEFRESAISTGKQDDYVACDDRIESLKTIPVVVVDTRDEVTAYLGVRHLGGIKRWEPLAQSMYVYKEILERKDKHNITIAKAIEELVKETSNKKSDVLNHFYKHSIYKNMQDIIADDRELSSRNASKILDNKFSLLEVAFGKPGRSKVAEYIGIKGYNKLDPEEYDSIIPEEKKTEAKNLIKWVFTENAPISESRQINSYLKKILAAPASTEAFEKGEDKDTALLLSESYDDIIRKACNHIHKSLTHVDRNWSLTKPRSREELKELYIYNVVKKVLDTNKTIGIRYNISDTNEVTGVANHE